MRFCLRLRMVDRIPNVVNLLNAAKRLGLSEDTMRRRCIDGDVEAVQLKKRGHWRVFVDDRGAPIPRRGRRRA